MSIMKRSHASALAKAVMTRYGALSSRKRVGRAIQGSMQDVMITILPRMCLLSFLWVRMLRQKSHMVHVKVKEKETVPHQTGRLLAFSCT